MRSYEEYEDDIVERVTASDIDVSPLPSTALLEAFRPADKPRAFVIYTGSDFGDPPTLGITEQEETLSFEIHICSRRRRDEGGIYDVATRIMRRLRGWRPKDALIPITISAFGNIESPANAWNFAVKLSFMRMVVEDVEEEEPLLIKKITHKFNEQSE